MFPDRTFLFVVLSVLCACSKYVICARSAPDEIASSDAETNFAYVVQRLLEHNTLNAFLNSTNEKCRYDAATVLAAAKRLELWALKVADSSATIPSGLLQGNVLQFGDFDECLSAVSASTPSQSEVPTKYCIAAVDLQSIPSAPAGKLMRSLDIFRSNLTDCDFRCPTLLRWEQHDRRCIFFSWTVGYGLWWLGNPPCMSVLWVAYALDTGVNLTVNWKKLVSTERSQGDIACIHGVRAVHVIALLLSHKSVAMLYSPYANRTDMAKMTGASWGIIGRAAILYTDTFIVISGLLTAQSILRELNRSGRVQLIKRLLNRYMRLTPVLLAIILWCTLLLPKFSSGPLWGLVVEKHVELCKQYWWRNLLYIHNFYGFENMCLTHTHQLGIDMQLFLVAPALVALVWRYPKVGLATFIFLAGASTYLRYIVTYNNELSSLVYFGEPVSQMFRTATLSYTLPTHRATVYIFGLVLGWVLSKLPCDYVVPLPASILGWSFFGTIGIYALLGSYHTALPEYVYDVSEAANYAALAPVLWSSFLVWGFFACVQNAGGILNTIFSWRWFIVVTRLAYSIYLTQFPIFFYNIGVTRHSTSYGIFELLNLPEFSFIIFVSGLLTLFVELPFHEISEIILKSRGSTSRSYVNNNHCNGKEIKKTS